MIRQFIPVELIIDIEPSELPHANIKPYSYGAQATVLTKILLYKKTDHEVLSIVIAEQNRDEASF
jgi:hypothetical protein